MEKNVQEQIIEFERQRQLLMNLGMQKQQLQVSLSGTEKAQEELDKSKEEKVFVAIGNILIQKDKKAVESDLKEQKETMELRLKTVEKQEESTLARLNKLKSDIEMAADKAKTAAIANAKNDKSTNTSQVN